MGAYFSNQKVDKCVEIYLKHYTECSSRCKSFTNYFFVVSGIHRTAGQILMNDSVYLGPIACNTVYCLIIPKAIDFHFISQLVCFVSTKSSCRFSAPRRRPVWHFLPISFSWIVCLLLSEISYGVRCNNFPNWHLLSSRTKYLIAGIFGLYIFFWMIRCSQELAILNEHIRKELYDPAAFISG